MVEDRWILNVRRQAEWQVARMQARTEALLEAGDLVHAQETSDASFRLVQLLVDNDVEALATALDRAA
jgi:hypothetical protein